MRICFMKLVLFGFCIILVLMIVQHAFDFKSYIDVNSRTVLQSQSYLPGQIFSDVNRYRLPRRIEKPLFEARRHFEKRSYSGSKQRNIGEALNYYLRRESSSGDLQPWQLFINNIHRHRFHTEEYLDELLNNMKKLQITEYIEKPEQGTEFKFYFTLDDGMGIISKPIRLDIDNDAPHWMSKNDFYERFQSEVAAFHLSRILKFNLVPPVVSRYVNLTYLRHIAPDEMKKTFYVSSDQTICFTGNCRKKCNKNHTMCGNPDLIPTSFALLLPGKTLNAWLSNPAHLHASSTKEKYCEYIRTNAEKQGTDRTFLDIIDVNIFDFIQGNLDRHHYGRIKSFVGESQPVLVDNGRGFARAYQDDIDLLDPLVICCQIRLTTFQKLMAAYNGTTTLSDAMRDALATEAVKPLLTEPHIQALDRRLIKVLESIKICIDTSDGKYESVIIVDGY